MVSKEWWVSVVLENIYGFVVTGEPCDVAMSA